MNCNMCGKERTGKRWYVALNVCVNCYRKMNPNEFLSKKYDNIKARCTNPKHPKYAQYKNRLEVDRQQFYKWAKTPEFYELHAKWVESGYKKGLTPSVDRKDNATGYTQKNMQWLTMQEHRVKSTKEQPKGPRPRTKDQIYQKGREPGSGNHFLGW